MTLKIPSKPVCGTPNPIVYKEPTYNLYLNPRNSTEVFGSKKGEKKTEPYQNLDALVDEVMQQRTQSNILSTQKKTKKIRKEIAHSLTNRLDQESQIKIQLPLAKAQGLVTKAHERLTNIAISTGLQKCPNLMPLAEFVFFDFDESQLGFLLSFKLNSLIPHSDLKLQEALCREVCKIRAELKENTWGIMQLYRPPEQANGLSYKDEKGETVLLTHAIPSSYDQSNPHVQNGRLNLDNKGDVIYSAGRIETKLKAEEVLNKLICQTFQSGQITKENLYLENGVYLYPVVIENLVNAAPINASERDYLTQENEVLKDLSNGSRQFRLNSGETIPVQLKLLHFSTQTNHNSFLGQSHRFSSTGSDIAEKINADGTKGLEEYYLKIADTLNSDIKQAVSTQLNELKKCTQLHDRIILRAFICQLLNIPYHVHCKSSKDRTAVVVAIKKALHIWLKMEEWKGTLDYKMNPKYLFKNPIFKEYTEAAYFENLPFTDQGVGFSGVLDGKLYSQDRGFTYLFSFLEHPFPALALSDRYLHTASILERVFYTSMITIASLVVTTLYVAFSPFIMIALYLKYKKECVNVFIYLLLTLTVTMVRSAARRQWIDRSSPILKERRFILKHQPTKKVF